MRIKISEGNWGDSAPLRIDALLTDVASHITRQLRQPLIETVLVAATSTPNDDPITLYRASNQAPFRVLLSARDDYWCQFAYQFSHELCHILSGYERLRGSPNKWFHEAICELASVFTIRRMAEGWLTFPPFPGGSDYSASLASYSEDLLSRKERRVPEGMTLSSWLSAEERNLRLDPYTRDKNAVAAYSMLAVFENEPAGWNAVRNLPDSASKFKDYLQDWRLQADPADRPFVESIIHLFEA